MRVLAITNLFGFPWDPTRGMFNQQQFDRLAQRVDFEVLVAVPWIEAVRRPRAYWTARREGRKRWPYVDYFVFWYPPGFARRLHALCFLLSLLAQRPLSLLSRRRQVLLGSWAYPDAVAAAALGRVIGTPVVMKVHGSDVNDYFDEPAKRRQILAAARGCRRVTCASAALRQRLVDAGLPPEHAVVNYNGVDAARFLPVARSDARRALGVPENVRLLLYVGNLKVAKGCVDLLRAFAAIAPQDESLTLAFVGEGEARSEIEATAHAAGLAARVRMPGRCFHAELPQWFGAADVVSLPSHNEGVPNVVLEAMACGVPVVATRVGGIPEVLPEFAGTLVPLGDAAALAAALQDALRRDWDAARIVEHARRFSWERNVDRLQQLLEEAQR